MSIYYMNCFAISFFHLIYQASSQYIYVFFKWLHSISLHSYIKTFLISALQQHIQAFVLLLCYYKQCFSEHHFGYLLFNLSTAIFLR